MESYGCHVKPWFTPPVLWNHWGGKGQEEAVCVLNLAGEGSPLPKLFGTPSTKW